VLLVIGALILASLNVIYLFLLDSINRIKRIFWSNSLVDLSCDELKKMLEKSEINLAYLKSEDDKLSAGLDIKGRETENFFLMFKIDAIEAKINGTEAKINILKKLIEQHQPSENRVLAKPFSQRQIELESFALTSDYKLVEQFVSKRLGKDDLPKLQRLLENKGWDGTIDELQDLTTKESKKQHLENARSKILTGSPESRKEILKSYLKYYRPDEIELMALEQILEERSLSATDSATLQANLEKMKQEIETEQFEKSLIVETK
jgi:hypothetical protein